MALERDTMFKGYIANYWRIVEWHTDVDRGYTDVEVKLYKDAQARLLDENNQLNMITVKIKAVDLNGRAGIYEELKKTNDFFGAKDV